MHTCGHTPRAHVHIHVHIHTHQHKHTHTHTNTHTEREGEGGKYVCHCNHIYGGEKRRRGCVMFLRDKAAITDTSVVPLPPQWRWSSGPVSATRCTSSTPWTHRGWRSGSLMRASSGNSQHRSVHDALW